LAFRVLDLRRIGMQELDQGPTSGRRTQSIAWVRTAPRRAGSQEPRMRRVLISLALGAALGAGYPAYSQEEEDDADIVVLEGGNRLVGAIDGLYRGELSFSIDDAGTVDIDWSNVESLTSTQVL